MKTLTKLFTVVIMLFAVNSFAQSPNFTLGTGIQLGLSFNKEGKANQYQFANTIVGQYKFKQIYTGAVTKTMIKDSVPSIAAGMRLGYNLWSKQDQTFSLYGEALHGEAGKNFVGGGLQFEYGEGIRFNAYVGYEFKEELTGVELGVEFPIIK